VSLIFSEPVSVLLAELYDSRNPIGQGQLNFICMIAEQKLYEVPRRRDEHCVKSPLAD
jgi:hypothetical protein